MPKITRYTEHILSNQQHLFHWKTLGYFKMSSVRQSTQLRMDFVQTANPHYTVSEYVRKSQ
jgi:hypothetical protein